MHSSHFILLLSCVHLGASVCWFVCIWVCLCVGLCRLECVSVLVCTHLGVSACWFLCICVLVYAHECRGLQEPEEGIGFP